MVRSPDQAVLTSYALKASEDRAQKLEEVHEEPSCFPTACIPDNGVGASCGG